MLDAYIIERIRNQQEDRREGDFQPLRDECPPEPLPHVERDQGEDRDRGGDRGSVVIDFLF